ncbi:MAG: hypothetical protein WCH05_01395 [Chlorobiaceae bacterium]
MRLKKRILDRYEKTDDGAVIIDVAARRVEDLYEDFDKTAPYHKKDLDADLVDYLTECAREIGASGFVLRFMFEAFPSEEFMDRVRTSVQKFFIYQRERELAAMKKMLGSSVTLLGAGMVILGISLWVNHLIEGRELFINDLFAEGLTIVAWVAMWEGLATFLLNFMPHLVHIRLFRKIAGARVLFYQSGGERVARGGGSAAAGHV